jgi:hypothetical protein
MSVVLCAAWAAPALGADPGLPEPMDDREMVGMAVLIVIGVGLMVLSWVTRLYIRSAATTDPRKLATNDPWVRAYLVRANAATTASPHGPVSQAGEEAAAGSTPEAPGNGTGRRPS